MLDARRPRRLRVVIADDHEIVAEGLRMILTPAFDVLATVTALDEVEAAVAAYDPDVLLLDLSFGKAGMSFGVLTAVAQAQSRCNVLVLTAHAERALRDAALHAGATGFLLKTATPGEMWTAIMHAASARRAEPSIRATRRRRGALDEFTEPEVLSGVTPREAAALLCTYRGMTQVEIAARVGVARKTIEHYLRNVRQRLGLTRPAHLLRWVGEHEQELEVRAGVLDG